jgi:glycosyltransferase involved in cell wall biosynthesis
VTAAWHLYAVVQNEMLTGGVIEAQVVAALRAHSRVPGQPRTRLLFLEPASVARSERARETLAAYRRMWPEGRISVVPYVSRLGDRSPGAFLAARLWRERLGRAPLVFHCRGPQAAWTAHVARRLLGRGRIVFDVRGHGPYETLHRLEARGIAPEAPEARRAYAAELAVDRRAAAVSDHLFTVSPGLASYAVEELGVAPGAVTVVPSCVEEIGFHRRDRARVRAGWGVVADDTPVLVYSGRLGPERLPALMLRLFAAVRRRRPDARLVLLTYRDDLQGLHGLDPLLAAAGVPAEAVVRASLPRDAVAEALCGADVGLLFYQAAPRYEAYQAPIKVAEYLAGGLALAVTPGVGRIPDLVRNEALGWVIEREGDVGDRGGVGDRGEGLERAAAEIAAGADRERRTRCLAVCRRDYLWRRHLLAIRHAYGLPWEVPSAACETGEWETAEGDPVA